MAGTERPARAPCVRRLPISSSSGTSSLRGTIAVTGFRVSSGSSSNQAAGTSKVL